MGWTWEVEGYARFKDGYACATAYTGESLLAAFREMRRLRRKGVGCIRLTWRPA